MLLALSCPRCKCAAVHRSRRKGGLDWLMSMVGLRPARCYTCQRRFYTRYSSRKDGQQDESIQLGVGRNPRRTGLKLF